MITSKDVDCVAREPEAECDHGWKKGFCANSHCPFSEREDGGLSANDIMDLKLDLCKPDKAEECLKRMPRLLEDLERARTYADHAAMQERIAILSLINSYVNGCRWADEINLCYDLIRRIKGRDEKA